MAPLTRAKGASQKVSLCFGHAATHQHFNTTKGGCHLRPRNVDPVEADDKLRIVRRRRAMGTQFYDDGPAFCRIFRNPPSSDADAKAPGCIWAHRACCFHIPSDPLFCDDVVFRSGNMDAETLPAAPLPGASSLLPFPAVPGAAETLKEQNADGRGDLFDDGDDPS